MESDELELRSMRTNRIEMPTNFQCPEKWDLFIQSYLKQSAKPENEYLNKKKEIEQILLIRFLKSRNGDDKEEEIKSRNDLLEWLVAYDFSLARVWVNRLLGYIQTQYFGQDALMSTIIPVVDLTKNLGEGGELSSKSLVKALYKYQPPGNFDNYLIKYLRGAIQEARREYYVPGKAREAQNKFNKALDNFWQKYGRDPHSLEELAGFCGKRIQTIKRWYVAYSMKDMHHFDDQSNEDESESYMDDKIAYQKWEEFSDDPAAIIERKEEKKLRKELIKRCEEIFETKFNEKEKIVWSARIFEGKDYKEIYLENPSLLRSVENCRQIYRRARQRMEEEIGERWLHYPIN